MFKIKENVEKEGKKIECVCINLKDDKIWGGKQGTFIQISKNDER